MTDDVFPSPIQALPEADVPLEGARAYLLQSTTSQVLFMSFNQDVDLPEHAHQAQVGFVLEGRIDLVIDGRKETFTKGCRYYIPADVCHHGKIYAGYADITYFAEPARYKTKKP